MQNFADWPYECYLIIATISAENIKIVHTHTNTSTGEGVYRLICKYFIAGRTCICSFFFFHLLYCYRVTNEQEIFETYTHLDFIESRFWQLSWNISTRKSGMWLVLILDVSLLPVRKESLTHRSFQLTRKIRKKMTLLTTYKNGGRQNRRMLCVCCASSISSKPCHFSNPPLLRFTWTSFICIGVIHKSSWFCLSCVLLAQTQKKNAVYCKKSFFSSSICLVSIHLLFCSGFVG